MRGAILTDGTGSRLYPITKVTSNHLLSGGELEITY